jgi:hypothetical protein
VRHDQADIDIFLLNDDVGDERGAVDDRSMSAWLLRFVQDFLDATRIPILNPPASSGHPRSGRSTAGIG